MNIRIIQKKKLRRFKKIYSHPEKIVMNLQIELGNMVKNKRPEKGYESAKRNIDFSHVRTHQRHKSKRKTKKQKKRFQTIKKKFWI